MHISEGVLSLPVLGTGWALGAAGVAAGLKKTPPEAIARTALVGAALFLCSLVHVPLGPSSVHLTLLGLAGYLLGFSALPALFVALLLQALLFQFGGILVLGVNMTIMGGAAMCGFACRKLPGGASLGTFFDTPPGGAASGGAAPGGAAPGDTPPGNTASGNTASGDTASGDTALGGAASGEAAARPYRKWPLAAGAFLAGALAVAAGSLGTAAALAASSRDLRATAALILAANAPLACVEGAVTAFAVLFLARTRPRAL